MANTNTRTKTEAKTNDTAVEKPVAEKTAKSSSKPIVPKDIDLSQIVTVRNGFQGRLLYKSPRTGERFVWPAFGDEQEMELRELRNAKNTYKKYFANNWFMFDEDWIPEYLGVSKFYKNAIPIDQFDEIFKLPADKLEQRINKLSPGQRKSVAYRARTLINSREIDSLNTIEMLERVLGIELIEK